MSAPRATLSCLLLAAGCASDPTLAIAVHHPTGVTVDRTLITVYVSPSLTCDMVRFGDLDDAALEALAVATETLFPNGPAQGDLSGIPRVDHKVIVARGLAADGSLASGGCVEEDEIVGNVTLAIDTVTSAIAAVTSGSNDADLYGIDVTATDPSGTPIAGREVSWRVYAPAGSKPAAAGTLAVGSAGAAVWDRGAPTCTGSDGVANLHPVPPDQIGGYDVRARVAWTQRPVPAYSALTGSGAFFAHAITTTAGSHPCAIGHVAGQSPAAVGACLDATGATLFSAQVTGSTVTAQAQGSVGLTAPVGLFAAPAASGSDVDIYAFEGTPDGRITGIFGGTTGVCARLGCAGFDDIQYVPACGPGTHALLLGHVSGKPASAAVVQVDLSAAPYQASPLPLSLPKKATDLAAVGFNAAGCVTRLDASGQSSQVQVIVLDFSLAGTPVATRAEYACGSRCAGVTLPVAGAGAGFTSGAAPAIVITTLDASGIALSTRLISDAGPPGADGNFVELASVPSAGIPHRVAAGQLDADGLLDLVWDSVSRRAIVEVAYAQPGPAGPLSALILPPTVQVLDTLVGDITGDGFDDVLLPAATGVTILPTHIAANTGAIAADAPGGTCPAPFP